MPKKRQIPYLQEKPKGSGNWFWQPSKKLRDAGWPSKPLGTDAGAAARAAIGINEQVKQWRQDGAIPAAAEDDQPRLVRFEGLIKRYRASPEYRELKPSTQKNYDSHIRFLDQWAEEGRLPVARIDKAMVRDLREILLAHGSKNRAAAILRTLRLLLGWAVAEEILTANPAANSNIPEAASRDMVLTPDTVHQLATRAIRADQADMGLMMELGFWIIQRQADLRALNRFKWREYHNIDPRDAAVLAGKDGRVMGFRLQQEKTGTWVDAIVPPHLHDDIEKRLAKSGWLLFPAITDSNTPINAKQVQRHWRAICDQEAEVAEKRQLHNEANDMKAAQFRDLRRSGMTFYSDAGALNQQITALSGHALLGRKSILDTYIKTDPARAAACVAAGLRHHKRLKEVKG